MVVKAIAVDGEPPSNEIIKRYCSRIDHISLLATFTEEKHALQYLENHAVDLLFVDINMPEMSGPEFVKLISSKTLVVFISPYGEHSFEDYPSEAFAYLTKPVSLTRFTRVLERVKAHLAKTG